MSGKVRLDVRPTDLCAVVEEALLAIRPSAEAKQLRLRSVLDPNAGPVAGDPSRLQQVVWNLLTNAVKFTPRGGRIEVRAAARGFARRDRRQRHRRRHRRRSSCRTCSTGSARPTRRSRAATAASGSGCRSSSNWSSCTAARCRRAAPAKARARPSSSSLPITLLRAESHRRHPDDPGHEPPAPVDADLRGMKVLVVDDEADARELMRQVLERLRCRGAHRRVGRRGAGRSAATAAGPAHQRHRHARPRRLRPDARGPPAGAAARRQGAGDRDHRLRQIRGPHARAARRLPGASCANRSTPVLVATVASLGGRQ